MIEKGYAVGDGNSGQYRIPQNGWFGNSLLLDFTNADATNWWMSKRAYYSMTSGLMALKLMVAKWSGEKTRRSRMERQDLRCATFTRQNM